MITINYIKVYLDKARNRGTEYTGGYPNKIIESPFDARLSSLASFMDLQLKP